jgi:glycosyltransferase involved in cell wall biosynthesis
VNVTFRKAELRVKAMGSYGDDRQMVAGLAGTAVRPAPGRIAIVHDWLDTYVGSERALAGMLDLWPQADLYTIVDFLPEADRGFLAGHRITTSFLQRLPFARRHFRKYVALMPRAVASFDLGGYDMVVSSAHAFAKGVRTHPGQYHLCYCYTPMRYAWAMEGEYLRDFGLAGSPLAWLARRQLAKLREWDRATASRVTDIVAISHHVAGRVREAYGREAPVIYPPVDVDAFTPRADKEAFYVVVGRLVPYKRTDAVVEAFRRMPSRRLVVIGDGPQRAAIARNLPPNVALLGHAPHRSVVDHLQRARAFVYAGEEDFGIAPVEAMACGTPVIALARGALPETVVDGRTGMFFATPDPQAIVDAIGRFEALSPGIAPARCRERALEFSGAVYRERLGAFAAEGYRRFREARRP